MKPTARRRFLTACVLALLVSAQGCKFLADEFWSLDRAAPARGTVGDDFVFEPPICQDGEATSER